MTEQQAKGKRVAILLGGETFRTGGQFSRKTGLPESEFPQQIAKKSLMDNLIMPMKSHGFVVLCYLATKASATHAKLLQEWYRECLPAEPRWKGLRVDAKKTTPLDFHSESLVLFDFVCRGGCASSQLDHRSPVPPCCNPFLGPAA